MNDPMSIPTTADLECLILWPAGTVGERVERELIGQLLTLCREHGFGRVPQLAACIEEIWRDPKKREVYEKSKRKHLAFMAECREATR